MFTDGLKFTKLEGEQVKQYSVYINGSHVCINLKGQCIFQREHAGKKEWYDAPHKQIVDAIAALEDALRKAV